MPTITVNRQKLKISSPYDLHKNNWQNNKKTAIGQNDLLCIKRRWANIKHKNRAEDTLSTYGLMDKKHI